MRLTQVQDANEIWNVLQLSDTLDLEFAAALSEFVPVILWEPVRRLFSADDSFQETERTHPGTRLRIRTFPLLRGYARFPIASLVPLGPSLTERIARQAADPKYSVLVCTTPFFAPVAERWPGPVVYWLADLVARYSRSSYDRVRKLDERLCRVARKVYPNSTRIAEYLQTQASCPAEKCVVLPNATGVRSLLPAPLLRAAPLPAPFTDLPRPLAGVIGNLAENTDWLFVAELLRRAPWLHWLFVGSTQMPIRDRRQRRARMWVMRHERTTFAGSQPYTELFHFARGVDVAVLPYNLREPTFSGSSTRFYDHLAACHPILATTAVFALRSKEPLLKLVRDAGEAAEVLAALRDRRFDDGWRAARWEASRSNTWRDRACTMRAMLERPGISSQSVRFAAQT